MDINKDNKYIVVAYRLYTTIDGERQLIEETPEGRPFHFISGMGMTLPMLDEQLAPLAKGDTFDFIIGKEDAYGDYYEERIVELDKRIFMPDGRLDKKLIYEGAIVPLMNEDGMRFNARVMEIGDKQVTVDLNHPYAGLDLNFKGEVLESRPATNQEIARMAKILSGEGGCGGCGGCGSDGGDCGGCGDGGCGGCGNG